MGAARKPDRSGPGLLVFGVIFPTVVIGVESVTRTCAATFFDPMPTPWYGLAIGAVPAINLLLWLSAGHGRPNPRPRWSSRRARRWRCRRATRSCSCRSCRSR